MSPTVPQPLAYTATLPRWVSWRYETKQGHRTKVPYSAYGTRADVKNPKCLAPASELSLQKADGIGFVFLPEQPEKGVDLDACLDEQGNPLPWARDIIEMLDSYTEISPSGIGVKVFFKGPKVIKIDRKTVSWPSQREKNHEIAFYTCGYFTVTGQVFRDRPVREVDESTIQRVLNIIEKKRLEKNTPKTVSLLMQEKSTPEKYSQSNRQLPLPEDLKTLIEFGVPEGTRSEQFHRAVCWLGDLGWGQKEIKQLLELHPGGIAAKFIDRLDAEIARSLGKRQPMNDAASANDIASSAVDTSGTAVFDLRSFMAKMSDLEFVWRLVLRRGWLYALTANPGAGKTAIALYLTLVLAKGKTIHGKETTPCRVLYLCGENPDDVRMRFALLVERNGFNLADLDGQVFFTERPFAIDSPLIRDAFIENASRHGPFDFCVIDTGPAHASLDDENDNRAMHKLAIAMRQTAERIGSPCTLALMHPVKNAVRGNLLPRGGSSFTGSIDGVLCAWRDGGKIVEIFPHQDKFRGEHFESMYFELEPIEHPSIKDNFGHPGRAVIAKEISNPLDDAISDDFMETMPSLEIDFLRMIKRIADDGDWVGTSQKGTASNNLWRYRNHTAFPDYMGSPKMKKVLLKLVEELIQRGWLMKERRLPTNKAGGKSRDQVEGVWLTTEGYRVLEKEENLEVHF